MIRIGKLGPIILKIITRHPHNSIGNYLGPYSTLSAPLSKDSSCSKPRPDFDAARTKLRLLPAVRDQVGLN